VQSATIVLVLFSGSLVFTIEPRETVYAPPNGFPGKIVLCATNKPASIVWRYRDGQELDPVTYNITRLSANSSGLFLTYELLLIAPSKFSRDDVHCETGNVSTRKFKFLAGGIFWLN
jgi:hypothetical protein